jgi:cephalosporin-C deacetylase-like acetyl esterase
MRTLGFASIILLAAVGVAQAQQIVLTPSKAGGIYREGENIIWTVRVKGAGADALQQVHFVLKKDGKDFSTGDLALTDQAGTLETKVDEPGAVLATVVAKVPTTRPITGLAGALISQEKVKPSAAVPDDFDEFWKAKLAELAAVPSNPVLKSEPSEKDGVEYCQVTMDNIRGTHIHGQLARPSTSGKRPALLMLQYAGVYPLQKKTVTDRAAEGWLVLNLSAHDLPIDKPKEYYDGLKELADYASIGIGNRDSSYFLRMYLSCYRAVEYLASRDDWDGKTLAVMGSSQGGMQTLVVASLNPRVTAAMANVPAGCDNTGPLIGREGGWPKWYNRSRAATRASSDITLDQAMEAGRYYDTVNFVRQIKCPTLMTVGLIDTTCPPAGVLAAYNQIIAPKRLIVMERADHLGHGFSHKPWHEESARWLKALLEGKSLPQ